MCYFQYVAVNVCIRLKLQPFCIYIFCFIVFSVYLTLKLHIRDTVSMCTTFVVFRFAHFKHKQGDAKNKRGLHDPNHAPYMPGGHLQWSTSILNVKCLAASYISEIEKGCQNFETGQV